jgi:hypothetical protein
MRSWWWLWLALLCATGAVVRGRDLGAPSLSLAEIRAVLTADRPLSELPSAVAAQVGSTPLSSVIGHAAARKFGRTEIVTRAPNAIAGSLAIAAIALISRAWFGTSGLIAAALLAISPPHIADSRMVDGSAFVGLLGLLLLAAAVETGAHPTLRRLLSLIALGVVALYTHYGEALIWLAILLVVTAYAASRAISPRGAAFVVIAAVLSFSLFVPWLLLDYQSGRGAILFAPRGLGAHLRDVAAVWAHDRRLGWSWTLAAAALALTGVISGLWQKRYPTLLLSTSIVAVVLGTIWATARVPYPFSPAQTLVALPVYLLLIARGIETLLWPLRARWGDASEVAAAAAIVIGATALPLAPVQPGPDWRTVAAVVERNAWIDDTVAAPEAREALLFYAPGLAGQLLPDVRAVAVASALEGGVRGWLVAPLSLRLGAAWPEVSRWLQTARAVDLSVGDDPHILYGGQTSRERLLHEIAGFDLPTAAIARGSWLRELLQESGPAPVLVRFVDQLIAAEPTVSLRNTELLLLVSYLAHNGQRDRARDLAARIVASEPDWVEAQQAVLALRDGSD